MAERLLHNPHLEVMPDHAGPHYVALRNTLTQNGMALEQAVQALNDSWTQNHEARAQAWDQQVIDDAAAEEANQAAQQADEAAQQPPVLPHAQQDERVEAEKKKPTMKDFDDTTSVGNYIAPRPAQYALRRIEDFEYVELWYLTPEGCSDATQYQLTQNEDTFGLSRVDNMVTLKSVSSIKASKNVVPDTELSFRQMSMAKNTFIPLMSKYQWSEKAINSFAQLFTQLELHPLRQREFGEQAIIVYQARVRREWHDQLKLGSAFNIGILNEDLLQSIYRELLDRAQLLSLNEVSLIVPYLFSECQLTFYLLSSSPRSHLYSCIPAPCSAYPCLMHYPPCTLPRAPCSTRPAACRSQPDHTGGPARPNAHP
jgi:hypothetical protein